MSLEIKEILASYADAHADVWQAAYRENREATISALKATYGENKVEELIRDYPDFIRRAVRERGEKIGIYACESLIEPVLNLLHQGQYEDAFDTLLEMAVEIQGFFHTESFMGILTALDNTMFSELVECGYAHDTAEAQTVVNEMYHQISGAHVGCLFDGAIANMASGLIEAALKAQLDELERMKTRRQTQ